ncbi:nagb/rpia/CoA transferase-like protein, partial [Jaminaea rosea]
PPFSITHAYHSHLSSSPHLPHPIAAIHSLCDLVSHHSPSLRTVSELITLIQHHSSLLSASLPNPTPARAGTDLFARFVISLDWRAGSFEEDKERLIHVAREYAEKTVPATRGRIVQRAGVFLPQGGKVLTHSYSRVVMQLLASLAVERNLSVYVTESRPSGLGIKTYNELRAKGIPATLVLDAAVGVVMPRVDVVLVGAEGVAESGGVVNALGTFQLGLVAKSAGKPFYAAAESYKFLRLFPLSQDDLPTTKETLPLPPPGVPAQSGESQARIMSAEQEALNPSVDYTPPDLVTAIISDVGVLTPGGVADALLQAYGGA